ncbi:hypothetical protein Taro_003025 [Colocasia esculenta]|uniref:Uncharacterized protein n=1 Tax=Colocasia esculenta TaxID=4460 RepID=A0A843TKG5_COLES|nr:hypothetical protein [Colocasia esculenta]
MDVTFLDRAWKGALWGVWPAAVATVANTKRPARAALTVVLEQVTCWEKMSLVLDDREGCSGLEQDRCFRTPWGWSSEDG